MAFQETFCDTISKMAGTSWSNLPGISRYDWDATTTMGF